MEVCSLHHCWQRPMRPQSHSFLGQETVAAALSWPSLPYGRAQEQVSPIFNSLTFLSDMGVRKRECLWPFTLLFPDTSTGSGCGSVAAQVERGTIHSADYSDLYPTDVRCHCFFHAPEKHVIKVSNFQGGSLLHQELSCVGWAELASSGPGNGHYD